MRKFRYLIKAKLIELNGKAIRMRSNKTLDPWKVKELPDVWFPILRASPHPINDREMRCEIVINEKGNRVWLDIPFSDYVKLPQVSLNIPKPTERGKR